MLRHGNPQTNAAPITPSHRQRVANLLQHRRVRLITQRAFQGGARLVAADAPERPGGVAAHQRLGVVAARRMSAGIATGSPMLPSATQTLRSSPRRFARLIGLWRKRSRKPSSSSVEQRDQRGTGADGGPWLEHRGARPCTPNWPRWRSRSPPIRFTGQTCWQMSQPKMCSPISGRSSIGNAAA